MLGYLVNYLIVLITYSSVFFFDDPLGNKSIKNDKVAIFFKYLG